MDVEPAIAFVINGVSITPHSLDVLKAVYEEGSQKRAAGRLGISVPVLHRHLHRMEQRIGARLLITSPSGTGLTEEGERIVLEYSALRTRVRTGESVVVGGTIITEELLLSALSKIDRTGKYDLVISDDERNLRDFRAGLMDLVVLDDPLFVYELEGVRWEEVADDELVHVDRGQNYLRFKYGAQRLGFRFLDSEGIKYKVKGTVRYLPYLVGSNLSFFVNHSLLSRKGIRLKRATEMKVLAHKIIAVYSKEDAGVLRLLRELKKERLA
ncbi:MAG: LysR family transcriptional regulator [Methanomassiliicoccales archaeon]|nr:LysR family transcriptional regulator [Methanomassiliicoccales archaeon]